MELASRTRHVALRTLERVRDELGLKVTRRLVQSRSAGIEVRSLCEPRHRLEQQLEQMPFAKRELDVPSPAAKLESCGRKPCFEDVARHVGAYRCRTVLVCASRGNGRVERRQHERSRFSAHLNLRAAVTSASENHQRAECRVDRLRRRRLRIEIEERGKKRAFVGTAHFTRIDGPHCRLRTIAQVRALFGVITAHPGDHNAVSAWGTARDLGAFQYP